jgi:hypothetical protein
MPTDTPFFDAPDSRSATERWRFSPGKNQTAFERARSGQSADVPTALAELTVEDQKNGGSKTPLSKRLKRAIGLESEAEKKLREAQQATLEAVAIQRQWDAKVADLIALRERCANAQAEVEQMKNSIATIRGMLSDSLGRGFSSIQSASELAVEIAKGEPALTILQEYMSSLCATYAPMRRDAESFGEENGVPREMLDALPTSVLRVGAVLDEHCMSSEGAAPKI